MAKTNAAYQIVNNSTYLTISNLPISAGNSAVGSDAGSNNFYTMFFGGIDSGGSRVATTYLRNLSSWSTGGASGFTTRGGMALSALGSFVYSTGGNPAGSNTVSAPEKFNGALWSTISAGTIGAYGDGGGSNLGNNGYFFYGATAVGSGTGIDFTFAISQSDSITTSTAGGQAVGAMSIGKIESLNKIYKIGGLTNNSFFAAAVNLNNSFNGTSWSSEISYPTTVSFSGTAASNGTVRILGGSNSSLSRLNTSNVFNGTSWTAANTLPASYQSAQAGSF